MIPRTISIATSSAAMLTSNTKAHYCRLDLIYKRHCDDSGPKNPSYAFTRCSYFGVISSFLANMQHTSSWSRCPKDPSNDADGDGVCGELDGCPMDPDKTDPGVSGVACSCTHELLPLLPSHCVHCLWGAMHSIAGVTSLTRTKMGTGCASAKTPAREMLGRMPTRTRCVTQLILVHVCVHLCMCARMAWSGG